MNYALIQASQSRLTSEESRQTRDISMKTIDSKSDKNYSVVTVRVSRELHRAAKRKLAGMDDGFQGLLSAFLAKWVGVTTEGAEFQLAMPKPQRSAISLMPARKRAEIINMLAILSADLQGECDVCVDVPERTMAAG